MGTWQSARFYLPAIGPITLLATWPLTRVIHLDRLARRTWLAATPVIAIILTLFALASWSFRHQVSQATPSTPPHCNIGLPHCPKRQGRDTEDKSETQHLTSR
jgi:hypothetical protein